MKKVTEELNWRSKRYPIRMHKLSMKVHGSPLRNGILITSTPYIASWLKTPYHSAWSRAIYSILCAARDTALSTPCHRRGVDGLQTQGGNDVRRDIFIETFTPKSWIPMGVVRDLIVMTQLSLGRPTATGANPSHSWLGLKCIGGAECCMSRSHGSTQLEAGGWRVDIGVSYSPSYVVW